MSSAIETGLRDWRTAVAGVLAKPRKADPAEFGQTPEEHLAERTYDGVTVSPLYTSLDETGSPGLPGAFPYLRGRDAQRDVNRGWLVGQRFGGDNSNETLLAALGNGVSAVWLATDSPATALDGVLLDLVPVTLDAGAQLTAAAAEMFALLDTRTHDDPADVVVSLAASPLTDRFTGADGVDLDTAVELARQALARPETVRAITVDGTAFHNAGSSDAEELGAAIAAGLEYLRALTRAGVPISRALRQLEFRFAATDDQFNTIAKFRAGRRLWGRVAQVCGAGEFGGAPQHAVTSDAMMTQRDPWVNMLRTTVAAFAAGVGGADTVTVLPFDAVLPAGALGVSKAFSERIARNTQLLLLEESHVGRVVDPAAGSWFVEKLTDDLAVAAWTCFQQIEAAGGYVAGLPLLTERIAATRAQRESDVAHRKTSVTGVNEFPNLSEKPLPADVATPEIARYAAAFEELRDRSDRYLATTGTRPTVRLATLGPVAEHNIRSTFAANLLASGGIEAVGEGDAPIVVLCGADKRYETEGAQAIADLRATGATVFVAGSATVLPGADGYLAARIDAVAALAGLLESLGA